MEIKPKPITDVFKDIPKSPEDDAEEKELANKEKRSKPHPYS